MRDQKKTLQRSEVPNISAFRCGHRKYATRNKTTLRRSGVPARHADQKKNLTRTGKKKTPLQKNLSAFRVASGNVRPEKKTYSRLVTSAEMHHHVSLVGVLGRLPNTAEEKHSSDHIWPPTLCEHKKNRHSRPVIQHAHSVSIPAFRESYQKWATRKKTFLRSGAASKNDRPEKNIPPFRHDRRKWGTRNGFQAF